MRISIQHASPYPVPGDEGLRHLSTGSPLLSLGVTFEGCYFPVLQGFAFAQVKWITVSSEKTQRQKRKKCSWSRRLSAWMQPQGDCTIAAPGIRGRPRGEKKAKSLQYSPPLALFISVLCILSTMILTFWSGGAFFFQCRRFIEIVYHLCCSKLISIISLLQTYLVYQLV